MPVKSMLLICFPVTISASLEATFHKSRNNARLKSPASIIHILEEIPWSNYIVNGEQYRASTLNSILRSTGQVYL